MSTQSVALLTVAAALIGAGIHSDIVHRRISNRLNLLLTAAGFAANYWRFGADGLWQSAGGLGAGLAGMFLLYLAGALGAGDAKFMAAIGAWFDWSGSLTAFAAGALLAGAVAIVRLARSPHAALHAANMTLMMQKVASGKLFDADFASYQQFNRAGGSMPYGAFLGVGGLAVLALRLLGQGA